LGRLYLLVLLLRPVILRDRQEATAEAVQEISRAHGRRSLSAFAVQEDKHHLLVAEGRGLVSFAARGSVIIACGDPLASEVDFERSVAEYLAHASRHGWTPCIYEAAEEQLPVYRRFGLRTLKMAEEAILDLPEFSLAGGKRAALRSMSHKVARAGLVVRPYDRTRTADPVIDEQLEEISEEWLAESAWGNSASASGVLTSRGWLEPRCSWPSARGSRTATGRPSWSTSCASAETPSRGPWICCWPKPCLP
jgi:lysylphosphatidylglycerol synthetase-like protein (DUF2156 family)